MASIDAMEPAGRDSAIDQRQAAQWPVEQKITCADFVVSTDGALDAHAQQLERIFVKL
jgi:dephospho-CoA kinase